MSVQKGGRGRLLVYGLWALTLGGVLPARAGLLFDSQGFESPHYVPGKLADQKGWFSDNLGTNLPVVQTKIFHAGRQALYTPRGTNTESTLTAWQNLVPAATGIVQVALAVRAGSMAPAGVYFNAVYIYRDSYTGDRAAILYLEADGDIRLSEVGVGDRLVGSWKSDTWYALNFRLNTHTQSLDLFVNNAQVATNFPFLTPAATSVGGVAVQEYSGLVGGGLYVDDLKIGTLP